MRPGQEAVGLYSTAVKEESDYDMLLAERLVEGVDIWIDTPRRPWQASGTSGMKVLASGRTQSIRPWDHMDAEALYAALEGKIVHSFYSRDDKGVPRAWVARIRKSMARLSPTFLSKSHGSAKQKNITSAPRPRTG